MAIHEHSFGPFYFARFSVMKRRCPAHTGGIVEMAHPWRRGKAFIFRTPWSKPSRVIGIGLWFRDRSKVSDKYANDKWLAPKDLNFTVDEISKWWNGEDEAPTEEAVYRPELRDAVQTSLPPGH